MSKIPKQATHNKESLIKSNRPFSQASPRSRWWIRLIEILGIVSFLLALVSAYFQFFPGISVEPIDSTFTDNFQDAKFRATNESPIPVYNLAYTTAIWDGNKPTDTLHVTFFPLDRVLRPRVSISMKIQVPPLVLPDRETGQLIDISKAKRPMMQIQIFYTPFGLKFLQTHTSRLFWSYKTGNGVYVWLPAGGGKIFKEVKSFLVSIQNNLQIPTNGTSRTASPPLTPCVKPP